MNNDKKNPKQEHFDKYDQITKSIGQQWLSELVLTIASKEDLKKAFFEDESFNNLPLQKWDKLAVFLGKRLSLSERVCVLKHIAKLIALDADNF